MSRSSNRRWIAAFALASLAASTAASASPASDADVLLARGVELRRERKDAEALEHFERANKLLPTPRALTQIALAEQALNRWVEAEQHLMIALASADDPWIAQNRAALDEARDLIGKHLGWVTVKGAVDGAELFVNGRLVGRLPLAAPVRVVAGDVSLELRAEGFTPSSRGLQVLPGARTTETMTLERRADATARRPRPPPPHDDAPRGSSPKRTAGFVLGAIGMVGGGIGTYFGVRALSLKSDRDRECDVTGCSQTGLDADRDGRRAASFSVVGFAVGVAGLGASAWLLLTAAAPAAARPVLQLRVAPSHAGVSARWLF